MKSWCVTEHWITLGCYYIGAIMYSVLISNFSSILMSMNMAGQVRRGAATHWNLPFVSPATAARAHHHHQDVVQPVDEVLGEGSGQG